MQFQCVTRCLFQNREYNINRDFKEGDILDFPGDLREALPAEATYFKPVPVKEQEQAAPTLEEMTREELLSVAKDRGFSGLTRLKRDEILEIIKTDGTVV